jgi:hypothetical protein
MIEITVTRRDGVYTGFKSEGHAGYAEPGEDIVCAAVSVLLTNTVNSIEMFTDDTIGDEAMADGFLCCTFPEGLSEKGTLLMDSMLLGLKQITEMSDPESGEPYVRLTILEV